MPAFRLNARLRRNLVILLHCGISKDPLSAAGHSRLIDMLATPLRCPLCSAARDGFLAPRATNRGHARPFDLTLDGWHGWISLGPEYPSRTPSKRGQQIFCQRARQRGALTGGST